MGRLPESKLPAQVLCAGGGLGRTSQPNLMGGASGTTGRTNGGRVVIRWGGIRGGRVIGEPDPEVIRKPIDPASIADAHATVLSALGIDPCKESISPIGRPVALSQGRSIGALLS